MSFDNLNKPAVKRPNLFLLALLTFLATGVSLMVPLAGVVGGALIPVPATILVVTGRKEMRPYVRALVCYPYCS